jgi:hypothetical protein
VKFVCRMVTDYKWAVEFTAILGSVGPVVPAASKSKLAVRTAQNGEPSHERRASGKVSEDIGQAVKTHIGN